MFSNKNGCAHIKKLVKTLMDFFQKFSILTENLVDFDVTCSVILGTVPHWDLTYFHYFIGIGMLELKVSLEKGSIQPRGLF